MVKVDKNFNACKLVAVRVFNPGTGLQWILVEVEKLRIYLLAQLQITNLVLNFVDFDLGVQEVGHVYIELCVHKDRVFNDVFLAGYKCSRVPSLLIDKQNKIGRIKILDSGLSGCVETCSFFLIWKAGQVKQIQALVSSLVARSPNSEVLVIVDTVEVFVLLSKGHLRHVRRLRWVEAVIIFVGALVEGQIYGRGVSTGVALVKLNHPPHKVRVVLWKIVHVALNEKGNLETDLFEVQLEAGIIVVLDVSNSYKWIVMYYHSLERRDAICN